MKRCKILIPDAGPFNSLWVADALDLLLKVDMPIFVIDAVYQEMTTDLSYPKDLAVKTFIEANRPPITIIETDIGRAEKEKRRQGLTLKKNAGELAIADFLTSEDGLDAWIDQDEPVLILTEDMRAARRIFLPEPKVHTLGTIGFLRGLEKVGIVKSADDILTMMRSTSKTVRARDFSEPEEGMDIPVSTGSYWAPEP